MSGGVRRALRWAGWGAVLVVAATAYGWALWKVPDLMHLAAKRDRHNARLLVVSVGGAVVVLVGLVYTASSYRLTRRGQVTDRFIKALERLSSDDLYVRYGGVLALEQIVQDAADQAAHAEQVLGAFIRTRAPQVSAVQSGLAARRVRTLRWVRTRLGPADRSVERPAEDVQAALTALTRPSSRRHASRGRQPKRFDFSERTPIDLAGLDLSGVQLAKADLSWMFLDGANLQRADLDDASLRFAKLRGANLRGAYLSGADLSATNLAGATLADAWLGEANLHHAFLKAANLTDAHLHRADLTGADLAEANLIGADLEKSCLFGAWFLDAGLTKANLSDANLLIAHMKQARLVGANLRNADMTGANLEGADLTDANLEGADLLNARLGGANLTSANLERTKLLAADFDDLVLKGATWSSDTVWPLVLQLKDRSDLIETRDVVDRSTVRRHLRRRSVERRRTVRRYVVRE